MLYAVTAPGFSATYSDWHMVERAQVFYPYLKWKKVFTQEQAAKFLSINRCSAKVNMIYNYGDTFQDLYITAKYKIQDTSVDYYIDTRKVGHIHINNPAFLVENKTNVIHATLEHIYLNPESIASHMSAIYNLLQLVGPYIDVNLIVPNYSIFYALTFYAGVKQRAISLTRNCINTRFCKVGFTLKRGGDTLDGECGG